MRRRLAAVHHPLHPLPLPHPAPPPSQEPDSEPESSCSDSGPASTAFRPAASSPGDKESPAAPGPSGQQHSSSDYPSPNISVGPPIHPPPHLLPYLYPHGLYPGTSGGHPLLAPGPPLSSLFTGAAGHHSGVTPSLLFNAQLALAAQHPAAFFSHAAAYSAAAGLGPHHHSHQLKAAALASGVHRFAPYTLPVAPPSLVGGSPLGSAFETVTPGTTSPSLQPVSSPPPAVPTSPTLGSPTLDKRPTSPLKQTSPVTDSGSTASELKSIEKMVNGLEVKTSSHPDLLNHHHVKCEDGSK